MGAIGVVYDTNTLISAAGFGGTPEAAVSIGFLDEVDVFTSTDAMAEFERVLGYDHLPFSEDDRASLPSEFLALTDATVLTPDVSISVIENDPDDDKFLEIAIAADADFIVSGDQHLLHLGSYRGVAIIDAKGFLRDSGLTPPNESW